MVKNNNNKKKTTTKKQNKTKKQKQKKKNNKKQQQIKTKNHHQQQQKQANKQTNKKTKNKKNNNKKTTTTNKQKTASYYLLVVKFQNKIIPFNLSLANSSIQEFAVNIDYLIYWNIDVKTSWSKLPMCSNLVQYHPPIPVFSFLMVDLVCMLSGPHCEVLISLIFISIKTENYRL